MADHVSQFTEKFRTDTRNEATHLVIREGADGRATTTPLKLGDDEDDVQELSQEIVKIMQDESKVSFKEVLKGNSNFALFFDISLQFEVQGDEGERCTMVLLKLTKIIVGLLLKHVYQELTEIPTFVYRCPVASADGIEMVGQIVCPNIVVNKDRANHIRNLLIERIPVESENVYVDELQKAHHSNTMDRVIKPHFPQGNQSEVLVPLTAVPLPPPVGGFGPHLDFRTFALISNGPVKKAPSPEPSKKAEAGLKRRNQRSAASRLTDWTPLEAPAAQKGANRSGTGSSSTGTTQNTSSTREATNTRAPTSGA